ncbi:MAG: RagB/SusD family nutrient uptake outer membrane protein [Bacteroidales bacterium]|nr:RagB/SusD family nutrient uptake outer membrane protein [Bacteroidales bacterium]
MKHYRILAVIAAVLLAASCNSLLNKSPLGNLAVENYYTTEDEVNTAILGVYHVFMTENFGLYHYLHIGDNVSDDSMLANNRSDGARWAGQAFSLVKYDILPTMSYACNNTWNQDWQVVTKSNYVIENAQKNNIPNAEKYVAEATFLRSYVYFDMAAQLGGLPLVDHILTPDEYYNPRASMDETWTFIEEGFKAAAEKLPTSWNSANTGRATKGAALAMLARAYIYHASYSKEKALWQLAYDTVKQIESAGYFQLLPNFGDVFKYENRNNKEICFSIQFWTTVSGWGDSNDGNMMSFYGRDAGVKSNDLTDPTILDNLLGPGGHDWVYKTMKEEGVFVDSSGEPRAYDKKMTGWSLHCPTLDLYNSFEPGDPRRGYTIIERGEKFDGFTHFNLSSPSGLQSKKEYCPMEYRSDPSNEDNLGMNLIVLRYADVLLYGAEAANEVGNSGEALRLLNLVRTRARNSGDDPTVLPAVTETDQAKLRQLIWKERRSELAMEYNRYYDLARTGRLYDTMKAYYEKYEKDPSSPGYSSQDKGIHVQPYHVHMPISQQALQASEYDGVQTLTQNEGY